MERCLEVLAWFYDHMDMLRPLMKARTDEQDAEEEDDDEEWEDEDYIQSVEEDEVCISCNVVSGFVTVLFINDYITAK